MPKLDSLMYINLCIRKTSQSHAEAWAWAWLIYFKALAWIELDFWTWLLKLNKLDLSWFELGSSCSTRARACQPVMLKLERGETYPCSIHLHPYKLPIEEKTHTWAHKMCYCSTLIHKLCGGWRSTNIAKNPSVFWVTSNYTLLHK